MNAEIDNKNINSSFAVRTVKNVIYMYATLSDRLKQAGIKENKPKCTGKGYKHKHKNKRNKKNQKSYSKAYMSSSFQRTKKFRKPLKHFVTPYAEKSVNQSELPQAIVSKHFEPVQENAPQIEENVDKETIFASLDFIEDCQNYKKKVRKPQMHRRKSLRNLSSYHKQCLDTRRSSRKSIESLEKEKANSCTDGESGSQQGNNNEKSMSPAEKELSEALQCMKPLVNKLSSKDIAKIDKKYLDSILSFAAKLEAKKKELEKEGESKSMEAHLETKKKLTGRDFFELKLKTKEFQGEMVWKDSSGSTTGDAQTEWKDTQGSPCTDKRAVRDLTKSEEQIKLKKGKNLFDSYNNSKMTTNNLTHSKPDINDVNRKKRKPRNKFMKKNAKELIEISLSREASKVADVKELWRRKTLLKKSENSLTSHSSCTVPETDEYPMSKNLESYKILKKLVEEEITHISKKPENKNNTGEVKTKENNPGSPKQSELVKKPPLGKRTNELPILKRRLLQAEGKLEKPELLSLMGEDIPKEANPKPTSTEEKAKNGKIPSKIIENWTILNRLEQAFLALGTPTFPDKNNIKSNGNEETLLVAGKLMKETKKIQKYREVFPKRNNKVSTIQKNSPKTVIKTESGMKVNVSKEGTPNKVKKNGKPDSAPPPYLSERNTPKTEETNTRQKNKLQNSPDGSLPHKPSTARNTRRGARKEQELTPSQTRLHIKLKYPKVAKNSMTNPKNVSAANLERKKTFDVIPVMDHSKIQTRRSKSCGINDTSLKEPFPQIGTQDSDSFLRDDQKLRSKSTENDPKNTTAVPERLPKNSIKGTTTCEKPLKGGGNLKSVGEKDCSKGSRETTPGSRSNHERAIKNLKVTEDLSKDLWSSTIMCDAEKDNTNNNYYDNTNSIENHENTVKERAVKKRSILSVHANQQREQASRKLLQIEEMGASARSLENVYRNKQKEFKSHSSTSIVSTDTFDLADVNTENIAKDSIGPARPKLQGKLEISQRSTISIVSNPNLEGNSEEEEQEQGEGRARKQQLWELDLTHYRSIVQEIISHYKRIDGFLKQNGQLNNFTNDSNSLTAVSNDTGKSENDSQLLNINEYRQKIITEYSELPIFEYKSKMEQNKGGGCSESIRKRNLLVVKDLNMDADDDVKDYQPKIQKVLDSQLYVDTERLIKRKFTDKISSLQDIVVGQTKGKTKGEEWQRSSSTPGAFQSQRSYVLLSNTQLKDNGVNNVTSDSTTCYQDTETESYYEISG